MLAVAKCVVFAHEIQPKTVTVSHSDLRSLDSAIFPASTREASVESYIFPTQQQTVRKLRLRSNGKSNSLQLRRRRGPNHCHPPYTRPHISTARRLLLPFSARHALRSIHFDLPLSRCHVSCKLLPTRRTTPLPKCPALPCTASVRTAITIFCNGFWRETDVEGENNAHSQTYFAVVQPEFCKVGNQSLLAWKPFASMTPWMLRFIRLMTLRTKPFGKE